LEFALEELDVETPLMDFVFSDAFAHFLGDDDTMVYLTDNRIIRGVECHHIIISGPALDLQMWIEEGDRPLPRKVMMTSKLELGMPRYYVFLDWDVQPDISLLAFMFEAPDGSMEIDFVTPQ